MAAVVNPQGGLDRPVPEHIQAGVQKAPVRRGGIFAGNQQALPVCRLLHLLHEEGGNHRRQLLRVSHQNQVFGGAHGHKAGHRVRLGGLVHNHVVVEVVRPVGKAVFQRVNGAGDDGVRAQEFVRQDALFPAHRQLSIIGGDGDSLAGEPEGGRCFRAVVLELFPDFDAAQAGEVLLHPALVGGVVLKVPDFLPEVHQGGIVAGDDGHRTALPGPGGAAGQVQNGGRLSRARRALDEGQRSRQGGTDGVPLAVVGGHALQQKRFPALRRRLLRLHGLQGLPVSQKRAGEEVQPLGVPLVKPEQGKGQLLAMHPAVLRGDFGPPAPDFRRRFVIVPQLPHGLSFVHKITLFFIFRQIEYIISRYRRQSLSSLDTIIGSPFQEFPPSF